MSDQLTAYELTFILGEEASDADATKKAAALNDLVSKLGGKPTKQEIWGKRELAYTIKKNRAGVYATLWFDLAGSQVDTLEKELRFDESIIRSLVTKAYTSAQPGSLYPVKEDDTAQEDVKSAAAGEETATAEGELRRTATKKTSAKPKKHEGVEEETSEEDRREKVDKALDDILKDA